MAKILIVEETSGLADSLQRALVEANFDASGSHATDAQESLEGKCAGS
jgi:DNA-binding response OmpR family regulator